ncbi:hypothetical protein [Streptomyces sp. NPDC051993]|uniref:hypothetical protein n=1 Tax=unclassified Streptomyces TaxID=2593676 RepID=UPI003419F4EE
MRTARLVTSALLATVAALGADSLAYAGDDRPGSPELWPASAPPGTTVTANTTACGPGSRTAGDANAIGAGDFQMTASPPKEVLAGQFEVPSHARPGGFPISVNCENGRVVETRLPVAGDGGHNGRDRDKTWPGGDQRDHDTSAWGNDPRDQDKTRPGNNQHDHDTGGRGNDPRDHDKTRPGGDQRDHDTSAWGNDPRDQDKTRPGNNQHDHDTGGRGNDPRGHVKTGVGGSIGPDTTEIAAGVAVLAAAAVGGTWLLRRRASGAQGRG